MFDKDFDGRFECMYCSGTGLFKGFAEPEGTAVVCNPLGYPGENPRFDFIKVEL